MTLPSSLPRAMSFLPEPAHWVVVLRTHVIPFMALHGQILIQLLLQVVIYAFIHLSGLTLQQVIPEIDGCEESQTTADEFSSESWEGLEEFAGNQDMETNSLPAASTYESHGMV